MAFSGQPEFDSAALASCRRQRLTFAWKHLALVVGWSLFVRTRPCWLSPCLAVQPLRPPWISPIFHEPSWLSYQSYQPRGVTVPFTTPRSPRGVTWAHGQWEDVRIHMDSWVILHRLPLVYHGGLPYPKPYSVTVLLQVCYRLLRTVLDNGCFE